MSQCPFGVQVINGIEPALKDMGGLVNFTMNYIGDVQGDALTSMHGENEVKGNIIHLCAIKYAPENYEYMKLISCVSKDYRALPANWDACAKEVAYNDELIAKLKTCIEGDEGKALLKTSFEAAKAVGAQGSPTIKINGQDYRGGRTGTDFMREICKEFKGAKPEACAKIPEPKKINLVVIGDKRCTERNCNTSAIIGSLKSIFPGLEAVESDYGTDEGKAQYAEYGVKFLPAFIFPADVKDSEGFDRISRYLKPTNKEGFQVLQIGANFDPTAEICNNQVDDTGDGTVDCADPTCQASMDCREEVKAKVDVFVMSMCPFGVKALNAMEEVLKAFGDELKFEIHFIATAEGDGFTALHGQPEVDENIRELCAIKSFPENHKYMGYILCRNKDIRNPDWQKCVTDSGLDLPKMEACVNGDEGKNLHREDIKIGNALGISASPTWLANNKFKFSGVDPKTIQQNICQHNPELKGCAATLSGEAQGTGGGAKCGG